MVKFPNAIFDCIGSIVVVVVVVVVVLDSYAYFCSK